MENTTEENEGPPLQYPQLPSVVRIPLQPAYVEVHSFGEALRLMRLRRGMSVLDVARATGLAKATVYRAEAGQEPSWRATVLIAKAIGLSLDTLAQLPVVKSEPAQGLLKRVAGEWEKI